MLHLARGIALRVDVRDLLELESALERDRVVRAAPEEEGVGDLLEPRRELLDRGLERERFAERRRETREGRPKVRVDVRALTLPARAHGLCVKGEENEGDELRREGLRRRDADLGPRVRRQDAVHEARDRRAGHVHDADRPAAERLRLLESRDRVGRLARLRDSDDECPCVHERRAVTEFRRIVDVRPHARDLLEEELRDETRVPARPARDDLDPVDRAEEGLGDAHLLLVEEAGLEGELVADRLDHDGRLLGDLLGHEVRVAAPSPPTRRPRGHGSQAGSAGHHQSPSRSRGPP